MFREVQNTAEIRSRKRFMYKLKEYRNRIKTTLKKVKGKLGRILKTVFTCRSSEYSTDLVEEEVHRPIIIEDLSENADRESVYSITDAQNAMLDVLHLISSRRERALEQTSPRIISYRDNLYGINRNQTETVEQSCEELTAKTEKEHESVPCSESVSVPEKETEEIEKDSADPENISILTKVEKFLYELIEIVKYTDPMKDVAYAPVVLKFHLQEEKYSLPPSLEVADAVFNVSETTELEEDLNEEVIEYFIAEALEPTVCIDRWIRSKRSLQKAYSLFYTTVVKSAIQPHKETTKTEKVLIFYQEVLKAIRRIISYSLAELKEEAYCSLPEPNLLTNLVERLLQKRKVKEFLDMKRIESFLFFNERAPEDESEAKEPLSQLDDTTVFGYSHPNIDLDLLFGSNESPEKKNTSEEVTQKTVEVEVESLSESSMQRDKALKKVTFILPEEKLPSDEVPNKSISTESIEILGKSLDEYVELATERKLKRVDPTEEKNPLICDLEISPLFLKQQEKHCL